MPSFSDKIHTPRGGDTALHAARAHAFIQEKRQDHVSHNSRGGTQHAPTSKLQQYYGQVSRTSSHNQPSQATPTQSDLGPPSSQVQLTRRHNATAREAPDTTPNKFAGGKTTLGTHRRKVSHLKNSKRSYPHSCALIAACSLYGIISSRGGERPAKSSCSAKGRFKVSRAICICIFRTSTQWRHINFVLISRVRPHHRSTW